MSPLIAFAADMAASFSRTLAALRSDRGRGGLLASSAALVLLAGWLGFMQWTRVSVYRTSASARLEVMPGPTRVAVTVAGRVRTVNLAVGAQVEAGAVLLELDAAQEHIALERAQKQLAALEPELSSVARELAAELEVDESGRAADRAVLRETAARQRAAEAALELAQEEEARLRSLVGSAGAAPSELSRALGELRQKRGALDALAHELASQEAARRQRAESRVGRREQLERQRAELEADVAAARAEVERLKHELERRVVRAPVGGTLGDVLALRPGAAVSAGEVIATLVPRGTLQVVAAYPPDAIGRIEPGQRAQLRLDGFPWTHYGTVEAAVMRVGSELRDGLFRVELSLGRSPRIALRHGMTGAVDVEVERPTPFGLLVRELGQLGATRRE